jgi:hypothetical protein
LNSRFFTSPESCCSLPTDPTPNRLPRRRSLLRTSRHFLACFPSFSPLLPARADLRRHFAQTFLARYSRPVHCTALYCRSDRLDGLKGLPREARYRYLAEKSFLSVCGNLLFFRGKKNDEGKNDRQSIGGPFSFFFFAFFEGILKTVERRGGRQDRKARNRGEPSKAS